MPENLVMHCREWPAGFTVIQVATTIHVAYTTFTVSIFSLTMEVGAVTHVLHWIASRDDSQATHAIILTDSMRLLLKVKSEMGGPDWNVSMVDIHLPKLLWVYCPEYAGVKGNDWRVKQPSQVSCFSEDLKC